MSSPPYPLPPAYTPQQRNHTADSELTPLSEDYSISSTPRSDSCEQQVYPNPWDRSTDADSLTRFRSLSANRHPDSFVNDIPDGAVSFPDPQVYRSISLASGIPHRNQVRNETNGTLPPNLSLAHSPASPEGSSSHSPDYGSDHYYEPIEVTLREADDLSKELSNLSLDSEKALLRFQAGELQEKDQAWHRLVPEEARDALGKKEVHRQSVLFEVFKSEREYVSDLETVQEVFIRGLQEASPPIVPAARLHSFLDDVFGNLAAVLAHHQRMLGSLFARQREQHPIVQSVADIVLDTVLLTDFRSVYETYIKHYPLSESHHRKELKHNTLYQAFLSSVSSDPRVRKRDLITFLSRPVTRLPRLSLVLDNILKSTDKNYEHPDLETLPIILNILNDFIKSTQPGIESAESKVKFLALCESLLFRRGEIIDMDLYDESRTVVYSGLTSRLSQGSTWSELTAFLLDNYFLLTDSPEQSNATARRNIVSRPIHLSYLRLGSFTSSPMLRKERAEEAGLLDSLRSTSTVPMYPFTVYHASHKSARRYTLFVASDGVRQRWYSALVDAIGVHRARQDASMWFGQQTLTDRYFRLKPSTNVEGTAGRQTGRITCAVPFNSGGQRFLIVGCVSGIYVSQRGSEDYHQISTLVNPVALAALQSFGSKTYDKLIVQHETSLFAFSLEAITQVARGAAAPQLAELSMERIVTQEFHVLFFKCMQLGERLLILYASKKRLHLTVNVQALEVVPRPAVSSKQPFRPFGEPAYIPRDAHDLTPLSKTVGVCGKDGIIIMDPLNLSNSSASVVPNFEGAGEGSNIGILKSQLDGMKPLGLVRVTPTELLVIYDGLGCYITKRGSLTRAAGYTKWETPAVSYACHGKHLLLFSTEFVEVRDLSTGRIVQVIEGADIRCLYSGGPTCQEDEPILVAMKGSKNDAEGISEKIVELMVTQEISPQPHVSVPAMWAEWDM